MKKVVLIIALLGFTLGVGAQDPLNHITNEIDHIGADIDLFDAVDFEYQEDYQSDFRSRLNEEEITVELFPNPVTDYLVVRLECGCEFENVRITILDHNGTQVYGVRGEVMHEGQKRLVIPFSDLPKGNYYLLLHYEGGIQTRKIVKA